MGRINEPDNPTRQLLPIMSTKCWEGRKDKGGGGGSRSKTRLRVTKWCVKDGVWQRQMMCVTKLCACVKIVCERERVTKMCERWCVKSGVWKIVCDKVACERWCVKDGVLKMVCQRWCVKDGVWRSCVWKMVCQRWCVKDGVCQSWGKRWCVKAPRIGTPATPAMQNASKRPVPPLPPKTQVDVAKCTPATWNEGGCHQGPCLPRETTMDVTKCHACHAKCRGVTSDQS